MIKKFFKILISPVTMIVLLVIGATAMGIATFIENDFGAAQAREVVYNSRWFEFLMLLFSINLAGNIFRHKLYQPQKFSIFLFHIAFIVILLGAAFTRYIGFEGVMHIREGRSTSFISLQQKGLTLNITDGKNANSYNFNIKKLLKQSGFNVPLSLNGKTYNLKLTQIIENAFEQVMPDPNGKPIITFMLASNRFRGSTYVMQGETKQFGNYTISFDNHAPNSDINFTYKDGKFLIQSRAKMQVGGMMSEAVVYDSSTWLPVYTRRLYSTLNANIVVQDTNAKAAIKPVSRNNNTMSNQTAYVFELSDENSNKTFTVWSHSQNLEQIATAKIGNTTLTATIGKIKKQLPFSIQLDDFVVQRYPGSNSPSSFSSYVQVLKDGQEPKPFHIYMNNILKAEGYRFYQSSYDNDEKGSILSVNYDALGTTTTYIGYLLLFLGIVWSMVSKNTFLRNTHIPKIVLLGVLLTATIDKTSAANASNLHATNIKHAEKFGQLMVQDPKGRTKPIFTFTSDVIRKIARKDQIQGLTPIQVFLEMNMNPQEWMDIPIIKVSNKDLQRELGLKNNYAAYSNLIVPDKGYRLRYMVESVYNKAPAARNKYDKEIMKVDERLNIVHSIFNGYYLKIFPLRDTTTNHWFTATDAANLAINKEDSVFFAHIIPAYYQQLKQAKSTGNYKLANELLEGIFNYQQTVANYELPDKGKIKMEIAYNKINVFKKLFMYYAFWGVLFLFVLIGGIISGKAIPKWLRYSLVGFIFVGFLAHTLSLVIRWYISGHAPMSNGYESLIFISWVTMLAGFIFSRQSLMALSATSVLAGFSLMVANLSFMDPEITNLVPVLKSYWLTIHVSVITGSYGFLGLGALLGIINQILYIFRNKNNQSRIDETLEILTKINHRTLILGLYFVTIGTFLGAVWANESWGRYWGWDPKETWSLITMIIYTLVTHLRMVKGLRGQFAFNMASVYAFFSVLMTYFGVNYYLTGLHSYAAGDPIPIPTFVYVSIATLIIISALAWNKTKLETSASNDK